MEVFLYVLAYHNAFYLLGYMYIPMLFMTKRRHLYLASIIAGSSLLGAGIAALDSGDELGGNEWIMMMVMVPAIFTTAAYWSSLKMLRNILKVLKWNAIREWRGLDRLFLVVARTFLIVAALAPVPAAWLCLAPRDSFYPNPWSGLRANLGSVIWTLSPLAVVLALSYSLQLLGFAVLGEWTRREPAASDNGTAAAPAMARGRRRGFGRLIGTSAFRPLAWLMGLLVGK